MKAVITNPLVRRKIFAMFHLNVEDKDIASHVGEKTYKVKATRREMKLMRSSAPKSRVTGGFDRTGIPTVKKKPSNSNARVNQFAVLRAFLDQNGSKNMADVAKQFSCTRAYVSKVLQNAKEGGLLDHRNRLYTIDHEQVVKDALEGIDNEDNEHSS